MQPSLRGRRGLTLAGVLVVLVACLPGAARAQGVPPAACTSFNDDPLAAGRPIMPAHVAQLRACVDAWRARAGLPAFGWTEPTLIPGVTVIKAVHLTQLRNALAAVYTAYGRPAPAYSDASIVPGVTTIKRIHIAELRAATVIASAPGPTTCSYSVSPTTMHVGNGRGTYSVSTSSAAPACGPPAVHADSDAFMEEGPVYSTNTGYVATFAIQNNTDPHSRIGYYAVGGTTVTVTQDGGGGCHYSVSPLAPQFSADGNNAALSVSADCGWTATSQSSFIHVTGTSSSNNQGTISYTVDPNPASIQRTGAIAISGTTVVVTQLGAAQREPECSFNVAGTTLNAGVGGAVASVGVETSSGCPWSAASDSSFLHLSTASGTGPGNVQITVDANAGLSSRVGTLVIAGQSIRVSQAGPGNGSTDVTILVNGSFASTPTWMYPPSPEYTAIAATFGYPPIQFLWVDDDAVLPPSYSGIYSGGFALATFIDSLALAPEARLNVVAHSHGGNVALVASYYLSRPYTHLITLATPVNYDFRRVFGHQPYSHCQASSFTDIAQFGGGSPLQLYEFSFNEYWFGVYSVDAMKALADGDWDLFAFDSGLAVRAEAQAEFWWMSTKLEQGAANYVFSNGSHADLHEPPVWSAIKNQCALN